jgi:hypothetical protein
LASSSSCLVLNKYELKQKSDKRVSSWTNTLAASREKKLRWKTERLEREEEQRRALDAEEEEHLQNERRATIEKARRLLHEEKDKMKLLKSHILHGEVLASRKMQIEEKKIAQLRQEQEENLYRQQLIQDIHDAQIKEQEKMRVMKVNAQLKAKEMYEQMKHEKNDRILLKIRERDEETVAIQKIMASEAMEISEIMKRKQNMKIQAMLEIAKIKDDARHERDLRILKEKEDSQRREKELESQYLMSKARMEIEKMHFQEQQRARKLISDTVSHDLKVRAQRELQFFIDSQKVKAIKEQKQAEDEFNKRRNRQVEVNECRQSQLKSLQEKKKQDAFADFQISELQRQMVEKDRENEKKMAERLQMKNLEVRKVQEMQIEEKKKRVLEERQEALRYDRMVCFIYIYFPDFNQPLFLIYSYICFRY